MTSDVITSERVSRAGECIDGRYQLDTEIGAGGLGSVYRATQTKLARLVAVKLLHESMGASEVQRLRFEREARSLAALEHPNIVSILDYGVADAQPYIVTELLEGETLAQRLRAGSLPLEHSLAFADELLDALAFMHEAGVVHRDLKASNVFLQRVHGGERVKLLDFGLAKTTVIGPGTKGDATLTRAGTVVGTPAYMSPEQATGDVVDARSDVYAVGVLLYQMLTGRLPFEGDAIDQVRGHLVEPVPALERRSPSRRLDAALEGLIRRAMAKRREDRFENAREMLRALVQIRDHHNSGARSLSPAASTQALRSARRALPTLGEMLRWLRVFCVIAVVLQLFLLVLLLRDAEGRSALAMLGARSGVALTSFGEASVFWGSRLAAWVRSLPESQRESSARVREHELVGEGQRGAQPKAATQHADGPLVAADGVKSPRSTWPRSGATPAPGSEASARAAPAAAAAGAAPPSASTNDANADQHPATKADNEQPPPSATRGASDVAALGTETGSESLPTAATRGASDVAPLGSETGSGSPPAAATRGANAASPLGPETGSGSPPAAATRGANAVAPAGTATGSGRGLPPPAATDGWVPGSGSAPGPGAGTALRGALPPGAAPEVAPDAPPGAVIGARPGMPLTAAEATPSQKLAAASIAAAPGPPKPRNPWARGVPAELRAIRRSILAGGIGDDRVAGTLRTYSQSHPGDPRGHLLLGMMYLNRNWRADAVAQFASAIKTDLSARGAPEALDSLLELVASGRAEADASALIMRAYGTEALPALTTRLAATRAPDAAARLRALHARIDPAQGTQH